MLVRLLVACVLTIPLTASRALACGGFFCSQSTPVVQNAERIVFVDNGNGTLTAIVEIVYSGPSSAFSWVLPVPGVPVIDVASTEVLNAIDNATRPRFQLGFRGDGCRPRGGCAFGCGAASDGYDGPISYELDASVGVSVQSEGTIGPYEYTIISVDAGEPDRAETARAWLDTHGYDVTSFGADTLGSYLDQGLNLLAFRLTKNATAGSIRPVMLTYDGEHPMIPIRPTAVAATNDMGVLVFLYGAHRAVPVTYFEIEIAELAYGWPNPGTTYLDVVGEAIDVAEGHAFITEFSGANVMSPIAAQYESEHAELSTFRAAWVHQIENIRNMASSIASADGLLDAIREGVTDPGSYTVEQLAACMSTVSATCAPASYVIDADTFLAALDEHVVAPIVRTEAAIADAPHLTRLFSTLDPREMTIDPTFTFKAGLPDVSSTHIATSVSSCIRRDSVTTLEVEDGAMEVDPTLLANVPNPVRILAYDLYGTQMVWSDRTSALAAAVTAAQPRTDSGCIAREQKSESMDLFVTLMVGGVVITLARRRRR